MAGGLISSEINVKPFGPVRLGICKRPEKLKWNRLFAWLLTTPLPVLLFVGLTCACVIVLIRCDERQGGDGAECALGDCGCTTANSSFDLCAMSPSRTAIANDRVWLDNPRDLTLDTRQQRHETSEGHNGVGSCRVACAEVDPESVWLDYSSVRVHPCLVQDRLIGNQIESVRSGFSSFTFICFHLFLDP
jgi:hypothetical protein